MIISDILLNKTNILDAKLYVFENCSNLNLWSKIIFHSGTFESQARIHLLNKDELIGGENAMVQIHLDKPCVLLHGDRFIIRNTSNDQTLGGGEIIDAYPLHHRKRPPKLIDSMSKLAEGSITELIKIEVKKKLIPVKAEQIAKNLNKSADEIINICKENDIDDIEKYFTDNSIILVEKIRDERFYNRIIGNIKSYHKRNPMFPNGLNANELRGKLGFSGFAIGEQYIELLIKKVEKDGYIEKKGKTWILPDHKVTIPDDIKIQINKLESKLLSYNMQTPLMSELEDFAFKNRIHKDKLNQYLKYLVNENKVYFIEENYIHANIVDKCRIKLLNQLNKSNKGITIAEFRNLVTGNRKICLLLIALFDAEGIIVRKGDFRYMTEKGKKLILN